MDSFSIYLESNEEKQKAWQKAWKEKLALIPDRNFADRIMKALEDSIDGAIKWNDIKLLTGLPAERFKSIVQKMIESKEVVVKKLAKDSIGGPPKIFILKYGNDDPKYLPIEGLESVHKRTIREKPIKIPEQELTKDQVLLSLRKHNGHTTLAHLKYEYKKRSYSLIMKVLEEMKGKRIIDFKVTPNRYRDEPAVAIFFHGDKLNDF